MGILTVVVNRSLSDLFKTDSILNQTTAQQDQHEHPSLHLTLVYGDYQPTNTSADSQNNTSISIPNDVESEQQMKESKRTKDIRQFFDNVVTNHFSKALKNESFERESDSVNENESESIDDNEESNEIFDQTSKYEETSRKSMMDEPGDVGNQFIHSHLPKELVLDGQMDKKVRDVINNQVLHLSNEINPTGNKSSVILSKMKDQDYNQKSQTGQQEKEKLLQGESGQEVKEKFPVLDKQVPDKRVLHSRLSAVLNPTGNKTSLGKQDQNERDQVEQHANKEKAEKESSVFDNQVASQNRSSSNVSKIKNQVQQLVEHRKKDELEQPKEEDLEEEDLEEKEKKLEQREREQEEQEKLLRH